MNLLLDTPTLLWLFQDNPLLSKPAIEALQAPGNSCYVSHASAWEIAIKVSLGKLRLHKPWRVYFTEGLEVAGILSLPIRYDHLDALLDLPHYHRDPFDRLLVSQAILEDLVLVSRDPAFNAYPVKVLP